MTQTIAHLVNCVVIDSDDGFDEVWQCCESLAPATDLAGLNEVIKTGNLAHVQQYTAEHPRHSFLNFWTLDPTPTMRLAGHQVRQEADPLALRRRHVPHHSQQRLSWEGLIRRRHSRTPMAMRKPRLSIAIETTAVPFNKGEVFPISHNECEELAKSVVRRNTEEVKAHGNFELFEELFADFVDHTPQPDTTADKDGVGVLYHRLREAFPNLHPETHRQAVDGDLVTTYKTDHGTHLGNIFDIAPTGRTVQFETVDAMRVRNGRGAVRRSAPPDPSDLCSTNC